MLQHSVRHCYGFRKLKVMVAAAGTNLSHIMYYIVSDCGDRCTPIVTFLTLDIGRNFLHGYCSRSIVESVRWYCEYIL